MTEDHDDFAFEPVPGLPERLPPGETMLWQGSPEWRALAISAFHVRKVAAYFGLLLAWQLATAWRAGQSPAEMALVSAWTVGLAVGAAGILCALAWFYARGTIYTLTSKRLVIRTGLALPVTLNLPLALIDTAGLADAPRATASIALTVTKPNRIAWLVLWPNVRPWTLTNPQPLLRCLTDGPTVAPLLSAALAAEAGQRVPTAVRGAAAKQGQPAPAGATLAA